MKKKIEIIFIISKKFWDRKESEKIYDFRGEDVDKYLCTDFAVIQRVKIRYIFLTI